MNHLYIDIETTGGVNLENAGGNEYFRECFARRLRAITGLEDARSPARFRRWLMSNGVRADSVSREAVARMKKSAPSAVNEALQLWDLLSRTETRKYAVLSESMCRDERLRGLYRFGGHPQGRFSYPLIQLDNLPVCRHPDLSAFRKKVRSSEYSRMGRSEETPICPQAPPGKAGPGAWRRINTAYFSKIVGE